MVIEQEMKGNCHYGENEHMDFMKAMRAQNKEKGTIEINVRERIKKT